MTGRHQRAQEQFLRALIERIQRHGASGRLDSRLGIACGQQVQRRPAKLLHRPGRAFAAGHHEPGSMRWTAPSGCTSMTRAPWWYPTYPSWPGAASRKLHRHEHPASPSTPALSAPRPAGQPNPVPIADQAGLRRARFIRSQTAQPTGSLPCPGPGSRNGQRAMPAWPNPCPTATYRLAGPPASRRPSHSQLAAAGDRVPGACRPGIGAQPLARCGSCPHVQALAGQLTMVRARSGQAPVVASPRLRRTGAGRSGGATSERGANAFEVAAQLAQVREPLARAPALGSSGGGWGTQDRSDRGVRRPVSPDVGRADLAPRRVRRATWLSGASSRGQASQTSPATRPTEAAMIWPKPGTSSSPATPQPTAWA